MRSPFSPKPGDAVVRRPRQSELAPVTIQVVPRTVTVRGATSPMTLVYSYFAFIIIGAVLLILPFSSETGEFTAPIDALFTATSAATGTGLVLFDTADAWSFIGEIELAVLMFIGGLGFMTGAVVLIFIVGQKVGLQGQLLLSAGLGESQLELITRLAKRIIIMAITVQIIGAVLIFLRWYVFGTAWPGLTLPDAVWQSVFTSISGFNNAGFDIIPDAAAGGPSLVGFGSDQATLAIIGALILMGSISYTSFSDAIRRRRWSRLRLDTKLVFSGMALMLLIGFVAFIAAEWSNPDTIGQESVNGKITESLFHTVNRASGFSTIDYAEIHDSNIAVTSVLMFVGGASATTTAGIKVSTLMVIVFAGIAAVRGKRQTRSFGREIASAIVVRAFAVAISAVIGIFFFLFLLLLVQPELDERAAMFEIISAFATTGWSAGATPQLNSAARVVVTVAMFVGRFGPFTIALFMSERARVQSFRFPVEQVRIG
ncbi:MAG: hypothetical protein O3B04_01680 [Chloroflexi bacterium]|nr:hypothetical protein [Chloroflexota bacterium]